MDDNKKERTHRLLDAGGDAGDARTLWQRLHVFAREHLGWITQAATFVILLLVALHIFFPQSIEWVNHFFNLLEPSAAAVVTLLTTVLVLEKVFAIKDELILSRNYVFGSQDGMYADIIDRIATNKMAARKVVFLQHSGNMVVREICKPAQTRRDMELVLYQRSPNCACLSGAKTLTDRIHAVNANFAYMDRVKPFCSDVAIRTFKEPAALRAMIIDDRVIVFSWYLHLGQNESLRIMGSENVGMYSTEGALEFKLIHDLLNHSIHSYDKACSGDLVKLSEHVTLQHC